MPHRANLDYAIIEAAELAFDHAWRGVFDPTATASRISTALVPLFGISWSKKVIVAVDQRPLNRKINQLLGRVRNSPLPRTDYDRLADLFKFAFYAPAEFLPEWGEWRTIADRYRLDRRHTWSILASTVPQFVAAGVHSPFELAALDPAAVETAISSFDGRRDGREFWRAARLGNTRASSADALLLDQQNIDVRDFQRAVKRHRSELTRSAPGSSWGLFHPSAVAQL